MISNHREAFPLKKGTKNPVNANFDIILNECQLKMKDMINKKHELIKDTNILVGKKESLYKIIEKLDQDIIERKQDLQNKKEVLNNETEKIKELEEQKKIAIKKANEKEADFKAGINQINFDKVQIQYGILPEKSQYFATIKAKSEELNARKKEHELLSEQLYMLGTELRRLESEVSHSEENERITKKKADQGIQIIDDIYKYQAKRAEEIREYNEEYEGEAEEAEEAKEKKEEEKPGNEGEVSVPVEEKEVEKEKEDLKIVANANEEAEKEKEDLKITTNANAEKETEAPKQTSEVNVNTMEMLEDKIQHSEEGEEHQQNNEE